MFRRHLSTAAVRPGAGAEVLRDALALIVPALVADHESAAA
jgi:hypothetical protein